MNTSPQSANRKAHASAANTTSANPRFVLAVVVGGLVALAAALLLVAVAVYTFRDRLTSEVPSPDLYRVRGRVVDAETGLGLAPQARLRAAVATSAGPRMLTAYGMTDPGGAYEMVLSAGFDVVKDAKRIRIDADNRGYSPKGVDLPRPTTRQKLCAGLRGNNRRR